MKQCQICERRYRRSKGRAFGKYVCSDRCLWAHFEVPVDLIYERDSAICHLCGNYVPRREASRDHVKPRSQGGRSKMLNLRLAHLNHIADGNGLFVDNLAVYDGVLNGNDFAYLDTHGMPLSIPEPATATLGLLGLTALLVRRKRA